MEIETGSWAGNRRLVVCIVSKVFEESSGNCVCSNVKNNFLVPLCIVSLSAAHLCDHGDRHFYRAMAKGDIRMTKATGCHLRTDMCSAWAAHGEEGGEEVRKREKGTAQSTDVTATGNGQRASK